MTIKTSIIVIVLICLKTVDANCQMVAANNTAGVTMRTVNKPFLMIVDNQIITNPSECLITPNSIMAMDIVHPADVRTKHYGDSDKNSIILLTLKDSSKLAGLSDLLDKYKIVPNDRGLKVCINENIVQHPDKILADPTAIIGIEVRIGKYWDRSHQSTIEERFINIRPLDRGTSH